MTRVRKLFAALLVSALGALTPVAAHAAPAHPDAVRLHGHVFDCHGFSGFDSMCFDPTTGFGPVVYIFHGTATAYAVGVDSICGFPYPDGTWDGQVNSFYRAYGDDTHSASGWVTLGYPSGGWYLSFSDGTLSGCSGSRVVNAVSGANYGGILWNYEAYNVSFAWGVH